MKHKFDYLLAAMWLNLVAIIVVGTLWSTFKSTGPACIVALFSYLAVLGLWVAAVSEALED